MTSQSVFCTFYAEVVVLAVREALYDNFAYQYNKTSNSSDN